MLLFLFGHLDNSQLNVFKTMSKLELVVLYIISTDFNVIILLTYNRLFEIKP